MTNCYDHTASVTDMLNNLGWDSLELRRKRNGLAIMYMLHNGLAEIEKYKYLFPESHVRISRHLHNLACKVVSSSKNYHKFSFFLSKDYKRMEQPATKHG